MPLFGDKIFRIFFKSVDLPQPFGPKIPTNSPFLKFKSIFFSISFLPVQADDVVARADHVLPPLALDVLLELDAQRPVVPGGAGAAVDLPAGEDEAAPLGEVDDAIERGGGLCHRILLIWSLSETR